MAIRNNNDQAWLIEGVDFDGMRKHALVGFVGKLVHAIVS